MKRSAPASAIAVKHAPLTSYDGPSITGQIRGASGGCLDVGGDTASGSAMSLIACDGDAEQEWTLAANGTIEAAGRCLGADPVATGSEGPVGLYGCTNAATQLWNEDNEGAIVNVGSSLCLDLNGDSVSGQVVAGSCAAGAYQKWTVPNAAVDPSGLAMPVGNIPGWRQVFADDFGENVPIGDFPAAVSAKWSDYDDGWKDTSGNGTYEPTKVVSIDNGLMDLYLHTEDGVHMVAAPVPVIPGASGPAGGMIYGRYEVRFKAQPIEGYKTAWLLWPDSNQWADGEIDFPEGDLNNTFDAFMHHVGEPQNQDYYLTSDTYGSWHTAAIEWTSSSVTFLLDGKVIGVSADKSFIPDTPMHWVLQTETWLDGGATPSSAAGHVDIDWVAVYAPQG